jgi:hypothetical protein
LKIEVFWILMACVPGRARLLKMDERFRERAFRFGLESRAAAAGQSLLASLASKPAA